MLFFRQSNSKVMMISDSSDFTVKSGNVERPSCVKIFFSQRTHRVIENSLKISLELPDQGGVRM